MEKKALRRKYKHVRELTASKSNIYKDGGFESLLQAILNQKAPKVIFAYVPFQSEIDVLTGLIKFIKKSPETVLALPCVESSEEIVFYPFKEGSALIQNSWGILEPARSSEELKPSSEDLMILPCLAVDQLGCRLGYGGGYYDRFLKNYPDVYKLGISWEACFTDVLPKDPWDILLDSLLTEKKHYFLNA